MLIKYLTFNNLLKFDLWWKTPDKTRLNTSYNSFYIWKDIYVYTLTPFTFIFSKVLNVFLDYLVSNGKVFFYTTLFENPIKNKEFLIYCSTFYITNVWTRGFLTNFDKLRWKIFKNHNYFLNSQQPELLISLTDNNIPLKEAKILNIPSISLNNSATYNLIGNDNNNNKYFYITFFFTLLHIYYFKPL